VWLVYNTKLDMALHGRYRGFSMKFSGIKPAHARNPFVSSRAHVGRGASFRTAALSPKTTRSENPPLDEYYNSLFTAFGPQHWWPGKSQFEVIVGAILTQNTSWRNVESAIEKLRREHLLSPQAIEETRIRHLEHLIHSSGYYRQKARKLKEFCKFLRTQYRGSLKRMFATPTMELREKLLAVFGIGPETADSILLYAGGHGVFVVDAYTKRIMARHGWTGERAKYEDLRWMFERQFPGDAPRFNEFHALIVRAGKEFCRPQEARCGECPLGHYREEGR
jgi:endonuclease-3 related protein